MTILKRFTPKKIRKGPKQRSKDTTVFRDYRGTEGAVDDAEGMPSERQRRGQSTDDAQ